MEFISNWVGNIPDLAVPYTLAVLGLIITERSGVLALGAEGLMLVGALFGIGGYLIFDSTGIALIFAMLAASLVSILFAIMVLFLRINQVIAGLALVFFCQGLTALLGTQFGWASRPVPGLDTWTLWPLSELPIIGRLFIQNPVVFFTPLILFAVTLYLNQSMSGLKLRAVGENPQAADAAGISVLTYRFMAILVGAALIGLAGAYISVLSTKLWIEDMVGGRGWIAVALVIFARWSPWRAFAGAILFGSIEALIPQLAASGVRLPQYFVFMTPYVVTLVVMIWVALPKRSQNSMHRRNQDRSCQPSALGEPFIREERR